MATWNIHAIIIPLYESFLMDVSSKHLIKNLQAFSEIIVYLYRWSKDQRWWLIQLFENHILEYCRDFK
jgi:hypothetical protein